MALSFKFHIHCLRCNIIIINSSYDNFSGSLAFSPSSLFVKVQVTDLCSGDVNCAVNEMN